MTSTFTAVTRQGADTFLQLGFTAAAGTLTGNGGTAVVDSRFNSLNPAFGITYTQTNDYSFDATKTALDRLDARDAVPAGHADLGYRAAGVVTPAGSRASILREGPLVARRQRRGRAALAWGNSPLCDAYGERANFTTRSADHQNRVRKISNRMLGVGAVPGRGIDASRRLGGARAVRRRQEEAQALQVEGVRLLQKGDNGGALAKFNEAFALVQSPKIMFNMGKAYRAWATTSKRCAPSTRSWTKRRTRPRPAAPTPSVRCRRCAPSSRTSKSRPRTAAAPCASTVATWARRHWCVRSWSRPECTRSSSRRRACSTETRSVAPIAGQKLRVRGQAVAGSAARARRDRSRRRRSSHDSAGHNGKRGARQRPTTTRPTPANRAPPRRIVDNPPVEPPPPGRPWQLNAGVGFGRYRRARTGAVGSRRRCLWSQKNDAVQRRRHGDCSAIASPSDFGGGVCPGLNKPAKLRLTLAIAGYATAGAAAIGALIFVLTAPDGSSDAHAPAGSTVSLGCLPTASSGLSCALTTRF